ncbi:MAG TPA: hypothetical protein VHN14_00035 [Kofleriaceae bacterium]|jgi:hypothetical protein|nr:hypothetical protein [Kofleriaceae bacterium]
MAVDDNENGTALAAGLVGVGAGALIGAALTNRPESRAIFATHLQRGLTPAGIVLAAANLGRSDTGPVWVLTLRLPTGSLLSLQAAVNPGIDPLEPDLGDAVAQRIIAYLRPYGFAAA